MRKMQATEFEMHCKQESPNVARRRVWMEGVHGTENKSAPTSSIANPSAHESTRSRSYHANLCESVAICC